MIREFTCLYIDNKFNRFSILNLSNELYFCYWKELLKPKEDKPLNINIGDKVILDFDVHDDLSSNKRGLKINDNFYHAPLNENNKYFSNSHLVSTNAQIIKSKLIDEKILSQYLNNNQPIVFINCTIDNIELNLIEVDSELAFFNCRFENNFRLLECVFNRSIWFCDSTFLKHFSLKKSIVKDTIHMENCNLSGEGGASFRGVTADNLFLDMGVTGSDDIIWLNEISVSKVVSIGGEFRSEVQLLERQDDSNFNQELEIGSLFIGIELYEKENANKTIFYNSFNLNGYCFKGKIEIRNIDCNAFSICSTRAESIRLINCSTTKDLEIKDCELSSENSLFIEFSSVGRHLKIINNSIPSILSLSSSAVSENTYINENTFSPFGKLNIFHFTTSRFLITPIDDLYGNEKSSLFKPKEFGLIDSNQQNLELGEQYSSLKNWMADSGRLEMEDAAYFHMQNIFTQKKFVKFLLGKVFGWGIRLTNIALSSIILILIFSIFYSFQFDYNESLILSLQSFISSYFGHWEKQVPGNMISWLLTIESVLGVLFTTVFIGAYIRKLLR
jgi:hypothetical protein